LFAREDGKQQVQIAGLKEQEINNVDELMGLFDFGNNARSTGERKNRKKERKRQREREERFN